MNKMFFDCENLSEIDLSSFKINNVTDIKKMFNNYDKLNIIHINKINNKKIKIFTFLLL
jgi:surface protein